MKHGPGVLEVLTETAPRRFSYLSWIPSLMTMAAIFSSLPPPLSLLLLSGDYQISILCLHHLFGLFCFVFSPDIRRSAETHEVGH